MIVVMSLLLARQVDLTLLRPRAEQMFPMEQAEKRVIPVAVEGFIMKPSLASHVLELSGQHCCELTMFELAHWSAVQSWTAP